MKNPVTDEILRATGVSSDELSEVFAQRVEGFSTSLLPKAIVLPSSPDPVMTISESKFEAKSNAMGTIIGIGNQNTPLAESSGTLIIKVVANGGPVYVTFNAHA